MRRRDVAALGLLLGAMWTGRMAAAGPADGLGSLAGKVVWVDFWASWCVPCRRSFPWMNTMLEKYGEHGLQIVAVNLDQERAAATAFLEEVPAEFEVRFDADGTLAKRFEVQAMPSSYLLDAAGNVIERHLGFKMGDSEAYERAIAAALGVSASSTRSRTR
jgi:thiol-disulfide isomerase/thioredoxin